MGGPVMTKEEMIELAKQAGFERLGHTAEDWVCHLEDIEEFTKLVAEKEREKVTKEREFVGLTYEEKHEIRYSHMTSAEFIDFIEAKLKEKNNG